MPSAAMIGAGLIGRSWAIVFARAGWDVAIYDAAPGAGEKALGLIAESLEELAEQGLVADAKAAARRVRVARDIADALKGAEFIQESLPEDLQTKIDVFGALDAAAAPDAIIASSTSTIVASKFTENLAGRARCLVAHPVNPPHLVPLVELVGAPWTAPETIARAKAVYESIQQVPIVVKREVDGFILNRLQAALLSEAFRLVGEGYVSPQDCDKTLKDGLGLRWAFMGPFETIELNAPGGIPDYCARYGPSLGRLQDGMGGSEVYRKENVERIMAQWPLSPSARKIADKMRWRDKRLAALRGHKASQPDS
ncbi:MAG: 3-hydroxyacyl-CoA dehydrogenase [Rhizobiales bacterium]|nr:3-hydroxyacyl-CoA dehydrogenase [Hyphomicrobiales bacterium]